MTFAAAEALARALLYEGWVLYPYRPSALKNARCAPLHALAPRAFANAMGDTERWRLRAQVLVTGELPTTRVEVRLLQVATDGGAIERRIAVDGEATLRIEAGETHGALDVDARVEVERLERALRRVTVEVRNVTPFALDDDAKRGRPDRTTRDRAVYASAASTHALFAVEGGAFVSLLEPPDALADHAGTCVSDGCFPVLVGPEGALMLASPILLYDQPAIAKESPGDFHDGTEIDELLALRVRTLTDAEKAEIRAGEPRARAILERAEALDYDALGALHGRLTTRAPDEVDGVVVGDRVRLAPRPSSPGRRGDVMDLSLAGRLATVASIEQQIDGAVLFCVTVDDDPGADLGREGWPGHRFFFRPDELERVET